MREQLGYLLLILLTAAAARAQDGAPPSAEAPTVVRIVFEGNRRYTDAMLKEQIATKEGQPYDPGLLARDERVLREYFAAVLDIKERKVEGGVELTYIVVDRVRVGKVEFKGLARVHKKDFVDRLATRTGRPLLEHSLESDRRIIEQVHREKGYNFVEVRTSRRKATGKPDVEDVVFQVITNRRVRVKEVILEGARSLPREELLKRIHNSDLYRGQFLGLGKIFNPTYYDRAAVDEDRRRMEVYYQQEGWRDAKVVFVEARFDESREMATLVFRIDEGVRYTLGAPLVVVYAEGGEPAKANQAFLSPEALQRLSLMEVGAPFRQEDFNRTRRDISQRLWARAYARSKMKEEVTFDPDRHTARVKLILAAGHKYRVGRLRFFGNKWTRDNVLRRQFRKGALPGGFLDIDALQAARNRLLSLRYFSMVRFGDGRGWGLVHDPAAPEDVLDVEVEVEETNTRQFSVGAGVSTDGGAFGQFSITWRNFDISRPPDRFWNIFSADAFRGGGQRFTLSASPGTIFSTFTIAFSDPAVNDSRWSLATSISRRISLFDDYDQINDAITVRVGRFLDPDYIYNLAFDWSFGQIILSDPDPGAPVNALDAQGSSTFQSIGVTLRRAKRREVDAFLNGTVTSLSLHMEGGLLGGDVDIVRLSLEHRMGWRVVRTPGGNWHHLRVAFRSDWARAYGDSPEVPIFERFFLGGRNLRGFDYREVGPRSNGRPSGGEFRMTLSTQYTIPLATSAESGFGLDLVFFIDQGELSTEFSEFSAEDWRISAGFGFAIGFGGPSQPPLLIDFGFPLRSRDGDQRQLVSVAFERNF